MGQIDLVWKFGFKRSEPDLEVKERFGRPSQMLELLRMKPAMFTLSSLYSFHSSLFHGLYGRHPEIPPICHYCNDRGDSLLHEAQRIKL
jgi:hypothetical protein